MSSNCVGFELELSQLELSLTNRQLSLCEFELNLCEFELSVLARVVSPFTSVPAMGLSACALLSRGSELGSELTDARQRGRMPRGLRLDLA